MNEPRNPGYDKLVFDRAIAAVGEMRIDEAIRDYQYLIDQNATLKREAAYELGVTYQSGHGVERDWAAAERYYLIAEDDGLRIATYRLARMRQVQDRFAEALERHKRIASSNPSAAYWAYRLLTEFSEFEAYPGEAAGYLDLAIKQGHMFATRTEILGRIFGGKGLFRIPGAFIDLAKLWWATARVPDGSDLRFR